MKRKLVGRSASSGVLSGYAFVLDNLYDVSPDTMKSGDILVLKFAMPLYFEFYIKAGAIVTEIGGITCHAAGIAREMGIPCVVAVDGILSAVKTGEHMVVDGNKGVVYVEVS